MRARRSILLSVLAAGALVAGGFVAPATAATPDGFTATPIEPSGPPSGGAKTPSGQLAESDQKLLERSDAKVVPVMVKVDVDPVASYAGGLDGYPATSPSVTGRELDLARADVKRYLEYVKGVVAETEKNVTSAVPSAKLLATYEVAYGGIALTVPARDAKKLLGVEGVAAVQDNALRKLPAVAPGEGDEDPADGEVAPENGNADPGNGNGSNGKGNGNTGNGNGNNGKGKGNGGSNGGSTPPPPAPTIDNDASTFIGADAAWKSLGGRDKAGQGVIVGVIDSGIWPEHPMLRDNGIPRPAGGPWGCEFGVGGDAAFSCNDKLVGAYAFLDLYLALNDIGSEDFCSATACSARDSDGHGTHTATTAAGSYVDSAPVFGVDRGPVSGVAPGASVIAYRALGPGGGYTSDLVAAVQQTIIDGVDVINYSVSGSASVYSDAVELAFLDAYAAGITVNASAGNDGPGASTANHAGPWVTTVAASTFDREYGSTLTLTAGDGATYSKAGVTLTQGVTDAPIVLASAVPGYTGGERCLEPFPAGSLADTVVACERGTNGRVEKGYNALAGGAAGMVLYNPTASDVETDNHFLPTIHLEGPNDDLVAFLGEHADVAATWGAGEAKKAKGDVMAGFSSRGPIGEFLKPDVTAPGVQILAGHTPESTDLATGPQGELYQAIAGTSMSSPHAAGVSALVIAAHPTWSPGQVKSALMTSSLQAVTNPDGSKAGVFDRGAGSIRADRALTPTLTISESAADFAASAADPLSRPDLNIPSLYVDPLPGAAIVTRTVTNVSAKAQSLTVKATVAGGVHVTPIPKSFGLPAGASKKITFVIEGLDAAEGWHEGQVTITSSRSGTIPVVMPIAVDVGEAQLELTQSCDPTEIARSATTTCTVTASSLLPVDVSARIDVVANPLLQVRSVTAPAIKRPLGAKWSGTLTGAKPPTVDAIDAIDPAETPGGGYLPLSLFGIAPVAGFDDETIINFTTPSFVYGGEVYTSIGMTSNGYAVVGGGTSADVEFEPPATFPSADAPNNVLAPFWTDLNPAAGGDLRVASLTDGVDSFLVFEWEDVPSWSGEGLNSFQIWIQTGAVEAQWFTYGSDLFPDSASGALTGAENRTGTSGVAVTADPSLAYRILTSPPEAGGAVTFSYTLKGLVKGSWATTATLTSPALSTIPIEKDVIKVK